MTHRARFEPAMLWLIVLGIAVFIALALSWPRGLSTPDGRWMLFAVGCGAGVAAAGLSIALFYARRSATALAEQVAHIEANEARFRDLTELSSDWFWEEDCEHRYVHISGGALERVGLQPELLLGKRRWETSAYGIAEPQWEAHRQALSARRPFHDLVFQRPDANGELHWLSLSGKPVFDHDGNFTGYRGTGKDITERRNAELQLAVEHSLRRMIASAQHIDTLMPDLVEQFASTLSWDYGAFWSLENGSLRRQTTWLTPECAHLRSMLPNLLARTSSAAVVLTKALDLANAQWIEDAAPEATAGQTKPAAANRFRSVLAWPLRAGSRTIGVVEVASRFRRRPDPPLLALTRSLSTQIGQLLQRKETERELHYLASHDLLTNLPNRKAFEQSLAQAIARAQRSKERLAVLFIDLDRFKQINDALGHDAGDRLLQQVAQRLAGSVRQTDFVARLGGDEFVVIAEDFHADADILRIAAKLIAAANRPYVLDGSEFRITVSIGIAVHPVDGDDVRSLLKNADIAMYRAKDQGRANAQFYSARLNPNSVERLALETDLSRALERNEFELHFQPTVALRSGAPTGVEALLRWRHPKRGLLEPRAFLPLAEETGLVVPIGRWVMSEACRAAASWQHSQWPPLRIAINISPRQFLRKEVLHDLRAAIEESGVAPDLIELDITEDVIAQNPETTIELLRKIRSLGVRLAIDDFGAGHSSLAHLKRLPIDRLKIDVSLIRDIPWDTDDVAITRALISLAHSLRREALAEGVESETQIAVLRQHLCDEYQGFFYSRPVPADDVHTLLRRAFGEPAATAERSR